MAAALDTTGRGPCIMVTPPDIAAQILRCHHAETWTVGTTARPTAHPPQPAGQAPGGRLRVRRVPAQAGLPGIGAAPRPSQVDACLPLIRETPEKLPTLTASRRFAMVRERGYPGRPDHFRHLFALHRAHSAPLARRPRRPAEACLRRRRLPGEQAQVACGHLATCRSAARARRV